MVKLPTIVVNFFGGPNYGKTSIAGKVFGELKARGVNVEYVSEFARELIYDGSKAIDDQILVFAEQRHRVARMLGEAEVIVTDSPIILSVIYDKDNNTALKNLILCEHKKMNSLNFFIKRDKDQSVFFKSGRRHNSEESKIIDRKIKNLLDEFNIPYKGILLTENFIKIADMAQSFLKGKK